jgi:hybrid cluster-associated redox disulfide protein
MMNAKLRLDAHMFIDSILDRNPMLAEVFNAHGMACVGCVFSRFHSLADAAAIYGLNLEQLLSEVSHRWSARADAEQSQ